MTILNLGCGTKVSSRPEVVNIDWSIYFRIRKNRVLPKLAPLFLRGRRLEVLTSLPDNIIAYDLSRGVPFPSNSIDVVYHSHLLEHFDKDGANHFLCDARRVLKAGGIHRIVVPDLESICRKYLDHIDVCEKHGEEARKHDTLIADLIEQSVRREAYGTSRQRPIRRLFENLLLGDARRRGETHQWMYDRFNLSELLVSLGYKNPQIHAYNTSRIPSWNEYGLDLDGLGNEYKPRSLYVEVEK